jgi:integrase
MPRGDNDGTIKKVRDGYFIVRKRYTDRKGKACAKKRIAYSATEALRTKRAILKEIEDELAGIPAPNKTRTVSDAIRYCTEHYFKPPVYVGDQKIAGQRTWKATINALKPVERYFGKMVLTEVEHEDFEAYKEERLRSPVIVERVRYERPLHIAGRRTRVEFTETRPRTIASVNRELSWAHRVFAIALRKKWIAEHPFRQGDPLIETSLENKRLRILTFDEEARLFAQFTKEKRRAHLAFAVTMALETAMRKSEQFRLERETDVDIPGGLLTALSYKGKRALRRYVPITGILLPQLVTQLALPVLDPERAHLVFPFDDPKKAFASACRDAGIKDVTWHTLRHTAITRMVHVYRIPPIDVMKVSGHTVWKTFCETYVNLDSDMVRSIGAAIDSARAALPLAPPAISNADLFDSLISDEAQ